MSISRKSEIVSEEKLQILIKNLSSEDNQNDDLYDKINSLKRMRRDSQKLGDHKLIKLQKRLTNLEKNENWDEMVMANEYEDIKRRDSVNEGRPDIDIDIDIDDIIDRDDIDFKDNIDDNIQ